MGGEQLVLVESFLDAPQLGVKIFSFFEVRFELGILRAEQVQQHERVDRV